MDATRNVAAFAAQTKPDLRRDAIRSAAVRLEATFLAEMLKSAGLGQTREAFGGGSGEDQLSSFLVQAQADEMARAGGIGLTETFVRAMMERENAE